MYLGLDLPDAVVPTKPEPKSKAKPQPQKPPPTIKTARSSSSVLETLRVTSAWKAPLKKSETPWETVPRTAKVAKDTPKKQTIFDKGAAGFDDCIVKAAKEVYREKLFALLFEKDEDEYLN